MRALVTGGAGFVGSHVVEALRSEGHQVSVIDNLVTGSRTNLPAGVDLIEVDIRDQEAVTATFELVRPSLVFHLAAQTLVATSASDPFRDA